jgi:hypothetical protein
MHPLANHRRLAGTALGTIMLLTAALQALAAPAEPDIAIIKTEFGIFEEDGSDQLGFGATSEIPFAIGQPYGWLIEVKTTKKSLAVREEILIPRDTPAAPGSNDSDIGIPASRESLLGFNERRVPVSDGMIFGERRIRQVDKPGTYRLRVYVERKLTATFDYSIVAPTAVSSPAPEGLSNPLPKKPTPGAEKKAGTKAARK